jgi:Rrf2 family protein
MRITTMTRYGMRAVFDIAYYYEDMPIHTNDISLRQEIPVRYLEQILYRLKKADFIKTHRGPTGGYSLAKEPHMITLGDICRAVDEPLDPVCCVDNEPRRFKPCNRAEQCVTKPIWIEVGRRIKDYFDSVTIADLCEDAAKKKIKKDLSNSFDKSI